MAAIARSESKILARIDSSTTNLIDSIRDDMAKQETRLTDLEDGLNTYSDKTRRCNARIVGIKEGLENSGSQRPTDTIAKILQELLGLSFTPTQDRAHRSLRPPPNEGKPPRIIVVMFHYFREREEVFREAARSAPMTLHGKRVSIFPDYTAVVVKKRAAFSEAKRLLRSCQGVKFGIQFPVMLRITSSSGRDKRFEDPPVAMNYIRKNLKPLVNVQ
ncbi:hypothetical protein SKAU_G00137030 [Synaphobranchus kaupii]|uniref:L1 transposable element RRM domain-containing protein n=1 Tax=Synaphobranchus kaupii TaxID=118154 RepID=A0A9Q1FSJ7_SYNKA|nr:hypothetical protein SKAU_G00137030 [Synaphobranchus kaupii]